LKPKRIKKGEDLTKFKRNEATKGKLKVDNITGLWEITLLL